MPPLQPNHTHQELAQMPLDELLCLSVAAVGEQEAPDASAIIAWLAREHADENADKTRTLKRSVLSMIRIFGIQKAYELLQQCYLGSPANVVWAPGQDTSVALACQLVQPHLQHMPDTKKGKLWDALTAAPSTPLPVTMTCYAMLQADACCAPMLQHFTPNSTAFTLAEKMSHCITHHMSNITTKRATSEMISHTLLYVLDSIDQFLSDPIGLRREDDDSIPGLTFLTKKLKAKRPDGFLRSRDNIRMLTKWELRPAMYLFDAVDDLRRKTASQWPEMYYGLLDYLLTCVAAGPEFQFYAIVRTSFGYPQAIGPVLQLNTLRGRAELALIAVQLYRFLDLVARTLPITIAPVNKLLKAEANGITRTIFFDETAIVIKSIHPWSKFCKTFMVSLENLIHVYQRTRNMEGLVHCVYHDFDVSSDALTLHLGPVGVTPVSSQPTNELEMACAVYWGLVGLNNLHKVGIVHRDPCERNFTSNASKTYYFWLDLELAGSPAASAFTLRAWEDVWPSPLVRGVYAPVSDVYLFGVMLRQWRASHTVQSLQGKSLLQLLCTPPEQQHLQTEQLVQHAAEWLAAVRTTQTLE